MRHAQTPFASLVATPQGVVLRSSYDASLVAELKMLVPSHLRRFDGDSRTWTIAPQYATSVAGLCEKYIGIRPVVPNSVAKTTNPLVTRVLDVRYIGVPKQRDDGTTTAFGWCDGGWNVILPESVLRAWFLDDNTDKPKAASATSTLYGVLGAKQDATPDELKSAYRRAARSYHPDICHEPDAHETFLRIGKAWEILSDTTKRAKYNAGLVLEASLKQEAKPSRYTANAWRPTLRCGYIMVEAVEQIGRFNVTKILQWLDITRADGAVLVTSWPKGADKFEERWSTV